MKRNDVTRQTTVDSIFYPGKKEELTECVQKYLEDAPDPEGEALTILSPHAGYNYAGRFMGAAYKAASARKVSRVVILSRVHREPEKAIFLPSSSFFSTPAGKIPVDSQWVDKLKIFDPLFKVNDIPHIEEHSIEVQLPFIQYLWPKAEIVPILTGTPLLSISRKLAEALNHVSGGVKDDTLFVISSNLSAYDHREEAKKDMDVFLSLLEKEEWETFPDLLRKRKITACSADCLTSMYLLFNGRLKSILIDKDCDFSDNAELLKKPFEKRVCFGAVAFI